MSVGREFLTVFGRLIAFWIVFWAILVTGVVVFVPADACSRPISPTHGVETAPEGAEFGNSGEIRPDSAPEPKE